MQMNLEKYKNKSGFKIPHNYMEDLEITLFKKLEIPASEIKDSKTGFKVPEFYFEQLENEIQEKIRLENKRGKLIRLPSKKQLYYASAIAAIFLILFSTGLFRTPESSGLDSLEFAAMEQYIEEENLDLNYNDISNLIYEEGLIMDDFNSYSLNDQAVFDYLDENFEDASLILE